MIEVPSIGFHIDQRAPCCHPDHGRHPVKRAEVPFDAPHRINERSVIEHVHGDRHHFDFAAYRLGDTTRPFLVHVSDGDMGAQARQQLYGSLAHAQSSTEHKKAPPSRPKRARAASIRRSSCQRNGGIGRCRDDPSLSYLRSSTLCIILEPIVMDVVNISCFYATTKSSPNLGLSASSRGPASMPAGSCSQRYIRRMSIGPLTLDRPCSLR